MPNKITLMNQYGDDSTDNNGDIITYDAVNQDGTMNWRNIENIYSSEINPEIIQLDVNRVLYIIINRIWDLYTSSIITGYNWHLYGDWRVI